MATSGPVAKAVGASAHGGYAAGGVDCAGSAINVGAWSNGLLAPAAAMTLKTLMDTNTPDAQEVMDSVAGTKVAPLLGDYVSRYMIADFVMDTACRSNVSSYHTSRYPFYEVDSQDKMPNAECRLQRGRATYSRPEGAHRHQQQQRDEVIGLLILRRWPRPCQS